MIDNFIPENEYNNIIKKIPIFCIDFLIRCEGRYLLLKRVEEPMKGTYWVIGGRLRFKESIKDFSMRIQKKEIGRYFLNFKIIGISNYIFDSKKESRAIHTPTLLYEIIVDEMFEPNLDQNHSDYYWSFDLPELIKENTLIV